MSLRASHLLEHLLNYNIPWKERRKSLCKLIVHDRLSEVPHRVSPLDASIGTMYKDTRLKTTAIRYSWQGDDEVPLVPDTLLKTPALRYCVVQDDVPLVRLLLKRAKERQELSDELCSKHRLLATSVGMIEVLNSFGATHPQSLTVSKRGQLLLSAMNNEPDKSLPLVSFYVLKMGIDVDTPVMGGFAMLPALLSNQAGQQYRVNKPGTHRVNMPRTNGLAAELVRMGASLTEHLMGQFTILHVLTAACNSNDGGVEGYRTLLKTVARASSDRRQLVHALLESTLDYPLPVKELRRIILEYTDWSPDQLVPFLRQATG